MMDPEAAHIVLESVEKPISLLPWETCIDGDMNLEMVNNSPLIYNDMRIIINVFFPGLAFECSR